MPLTFRLIEQREGVGEQREDARSSALGRWYEQVRDTPLQAMSVRDLARACRQELFLADVVPVAVTHLEVDPMVGALYDGELARSLGTAPAAFWREREALRDRYVASLARALTGSTLDDETSQDLRRILHEVTGRSSAAG